MKLVCNDSSLSDINLAYSIVDVVFSRELFRHVSWAGGSKSGIKTAFRSFSRVLSFVIQLVRVRHPNWPEISAHEFFKKKIISCATARAKSIPQRVSRQKYRQRSRAMVPDYVEDDTEWEAGNIDDSEAEAEVEIKDIIEFDMQGELELPKPTVADEHRREFESLNPVDSTFDLKLAGSGEEMKAKCMDVFSAALSDQSTEPLKRKSSSWDGRGWAKRPVSSRADVYAIDPNFVLNEAASEYGSDLSVSVLYSLDFIYFHDILLFFFLFVFLVRRRGNGDFDYDE